MTVAELAAGFIESHAGTVKPATLTTWKQAQRLLLEYFKPERLITSITTGDARDFRNYLKTRSGHVGGFRKAKPLSEATVRRRCLCCKQFFNYAIDKGHLEQNPFDSKRIPTVTPKTKNKRFVDYDTSMKIMDALPSDWLRLIFVLARWGGMRVGSEPRELRWSDIDWDSQTITFRSTKTEHFEGREQRTIPILPELRRPLREVFDRAFFAADASSEYVLPELRAIQDAALRKPMLKAIAEAGAEPWSKLWTTLRASRDIELKEEFPGYVVDEWLGHSEKTSNKHYVHVTEEHLKRAVQNPLKATENDSERFASETKRPRENANFSGSEEFISGRNWT